LFVWHRWIKLIQTNHEVWYIKNVFEKRIATHIVELNDEFLNVRDTEDKEPSEDYTDALEGTPKNSIYLEFKLIFENVKYEAENDDEGEHDNNMQFNPKKLLNFCKIDSYVVCSYGSYI